MASYLTVQASAQTVDAALQVSTLLKYVQPSFEVGDVLLQTLRLQASASTNVSITSLNYICFIAVRSGSPVDVSIALDATNQPAFSGVPSVFYMRSWQTPVLIPHLIVRADTQATDVEVCVAGRRTAA
jgi:hypothetical protein